MTFHGEKSGRKPGSVFTSDDGTDYLVLYCGSEIEEIPKEPSKRCFATKVHVPPRGVRILETTYERHEDGTITVWPMTWYDR